MEILKYMTGKEAPFSVIDISQPSGKEVSLITYLDLGSKYISVQVYIQTSRHYCLYDIDEFCTRFSHW